MLLDVRPVPDTASRRRGTAVRAGVRVEQVTIVWMVLEATVAIGAGVLARSVLLTAFGVDSVIELVAGGVLLWRLMTEARGGSLARVERTENRAAWVTGVALLLLCLYVVVSAAAALLTRTEPDRSYAGMAVAMAAVAGMPILARRKRVVAARDQQRCFTRRRGLLDHVRVHGGHVAGRPGAERGAGMVVGG